MEKIKTTKTMKATKQIEDTVSIKVFVNKEYKNLMLQSDDEIRLLTLFKRIKNKYHRVLASLISNDFTKSSNINKYEELKKVREVFEVFESIESEEKQHDEKSFLGLFPITIINGELVSKGVYPTNDEVGKLLGIDIDNILNCSWGLSSGNT